MRDALGGTVIIAIIAVFIAIVSAYLAYNVNYTKAFKMKNKIISTYEEYNGDCNSACKDKIAKYKNEIGYNPKVKCDNGYKLVDNVYCEKQVVMTKNGSVYNDIGTRYYYTIVTKIDVRIPIVDNVLGIQVFSTSGNTKTFTKGS